MKTVPKVLSAVTGINQAPHPVDYPPCIYFLTKGESVVYVGQSVSLMARLATHMKLGKGFDGVFYVPVDKSQLLAEERKYIEQFKPELNNESFCTWKNRPKRPKSARTVAVMTTSVQRLREIREKFEEVQARAKRCEGCVLDGIIGKCFHCVRHFTSSAEDGYTDLHTTDVSQIPKGARSFCI